MDEKKLKKKIKLKDILILQFIIIIYTFSGVAAKFASGSSFLSSEFIIFYGIEMAILALYAIIWQQIIKKFDLSVAYANRSIAILWSMLWAHLIFREEISLQNIIGVLIVIAGTIIINSDDK